ncbi:MAG: glycosyl transferase family 4 [Candidatus Bathyarchaeota archaeon]|nr:glycosyl transferase family 4 [Candidatus Bathyarchaeota archaeon]
MAVLTFLTFISVVTTLLTNSLESSFLDFLFVDMDELIIAGLVLLLSFVLTVFLTRRWIRSAKAAKLVGKDMNKPDYPSIPRSGGLVVAIVICFSLLIYIFLKTFSLVGSQSHVVEAFAISATVLLAGFIGFIDDVLGWKEGLTQLQKVLLTVPIALPLTVLNVDQTVMGLPFLGNVDLGLLYPLLVVPLGIIGSTNGFNLLAGYNGLEAGMGLVIFAVFGFTGVYVGKLWIALIAFVVYACLLAFLAFNWYPAKIFPGNSFTYSIGALIATLAILGSMERIAVWLFIPYFLEILLYFRARVIDKVGDVQAFAKPNEDGSLEMPYKKVYDTTHFAIWFLKRVKEKVYERDVVLFLIAVQALIAISGVILLL